MTVPGCATSLESSIELLRTIASVLDIRTVFPRVSEIANRVVPHDLLTMTFHETGGEILIEAASTDELHDLGRLVTAEESQLAGDFTLIHDVTTAPGDMIEPVELRERIVAAGFHSVLCVPARAQHQRLALGFWSKRPHAFAGDDVSAAQLIADCVALAVSHEQLAEAAQQRAEADARADHLEVRVQRLTKELDARTWDRVIGESPEWRDVLRQTMQVAATDTTVLLTGESGTGKEVVARLIHRESSRKNGPFVAVNCAALPEQLLESELFGHERGAFTSAQQMKPGQVELAAGGVLFLDEVSEISLSAQAKLLRVLQEREFRRLGGTKMLNANIRVVAATNRDLRLAVERRDFREDLFYRLQVFDIRLPPLRDRKHDILPMADAFLHDISTSFGRPAAGLTKHAREALLSHDWPGNVRELRNALERATILAEGGLIHTEHLALYRPTSVSRPAPAATDISALERETIARVLRETRWNKSSAARRLGLSRTQLYIRLRKYGLEPAPIEKIA